MSESEEVAHTANDETMDSASILSMNESETTEDDDMTIRSDSNPAIFTAPLSYQSVHLSSEFDKTLPYFTAVTGLYSNDVQGTRYHGDNKRTHDGHTNRFDNSTSKHHSRHRQHFSSILRTHVWGWIIETFCMSCVTEVDRLVSRSGFARLPFAPFPAPRELHKKSSEELRPSSSSTGTVERGVEYSLADAADQGPPAKKPRQNTFSEA
ncbi:unnamed protein product [Acanthocheilonema viteae]|uniref:Uncharacterized protein n=1 Tax=Acanthocheilonema viteae TaxID=6277 RepID=A0A498SRH8_ACAVI|nr:unnamed protein product [Acanthocheilonema viteae]